MEPVVHTLVVPASRDRVWSLWTTGVGLAAWLGEGAQVEPWLGGAFTPGASAAEVAAGVPPAGPTPVGRIVAIDRPRLVLVEWAPGAVSEEAVAETRVEVRPDLDGARLTVTHHGWGQGQLGADQRAACEAAWLEALRRLRVAALGE